MITGKIDDLQIEFFYFIGNISFNISTIRTIVSLYFLFAKI